MITIEDLDKAKQKIDEAFDKYDQIGDKTTAEYFYEKQKQYMVLFKQYWSEIEMDNDKMDLIWGIKQMERELSQAHSPASNIMNICTEVLKQVTELKNEVK